MSKNIIYLKTIIFENNVFYFKYPLILIVKEFENYFHIENEKIGLSIYCQTEDDIFPDIYETIEMLWSEYIECDEKLLSTDGYIIKENLINFFGKNIVDKKLLFMEPQN